MKFDFYYGDESEQYSFYSVPKMFFTNDVFNGLSAMSKLLYSFLLDRMSLSRKRNWIDDKNRSYIKYSLKAIGNDMGVSKNSVIKYMRELQAFGLIMKFPKEGMEDIIYVMDFSRVKQTGFNEKEHKSNNTITDTDNKSDMKADSSFLCVYDTYAPPDFNVIKECDNVINEKNENYDCMGTSTLLGGANIEPVQNLNQSQFCTGQKSEPVQNLHHPNQKLNNNIYNINNNIPKPLSNTDKIDNDIYKSYPSINHNKNINNGMNDKIDKIDDIYDYVCQHVKDNIDYDIMITRQDCAVWYDDYYNLIVEVLMRNSKTMRISGENYSMQLVKKRFEMLNSSHLQYVHMQISKSTSDIKNIKAYLIKALFNAPVTINSFWQTKVNYDLANNAFTD